ncbi:myosin heavy chain, clone 203-like protein [Gossypium australe]|uniref:Myosin heavy chain, clone 203-like protein n=1 Tax=Gossypium australe TaxID=47621 RepID=A0A5B6WL40_9ROSI|nr:myosin heavy chain, clone 203-like protein [Gossypium australe]
MQEQLTKIQQEMRKQMVEFQRNMIGQLTQLLVRGLKKRSGPVVNSVDDDEEIIYSPINIPTQPDTHSHGVPVIIGPQCQTDTSALLNFPMGSVSQLRMVTTSYQGPPSRSLDINNMSDAAIDSESTFEQDMCLEGSQDFEDVRDCNLSPDFKPITPKASDRYRFTSLVVDYFTKWTEATSYADIIKSTVNKFYVAELDRRREAEGHPHGQLYRKQMMRVYNKKIRPKNSMKEA